ncbi:winged helix DNA-binding domain-containing protein [Nonomuraea jiangxiensis]|uniref:Winged helix DNA-binding domain-containing protein n=1 Tax=Nonomuraea jiangxiensis TaxID=633440 RepID=A0A1G8ZTY9_9ACTN|nr:winged helix DNA-binding domain-containing protein [Nonomuraea jiangxiensis]SDK18467.1 Winged helix DNA-binding domain-containing protein [Nonomuraea jiangxiensis]
MDPLISRRALNRATLDRQHLLRRTGASVPQVVAHLGGLQAQTPHTWYTGLWNRIEGFKPGDAADLLLSHDLVRIVLQRSTIHLVTARDCLAMRPLLQIVIERGTLSVFGRQLAGVDLEELAAAGRALVEERPMTFAELGRALAERWPAHDPRALGVGVRWLVPLVQVPPRGVWGRSGPIAHTSAESWLGFEAPPMTPEELVLRYLAAFGPASVADVQTWSGLTRLAEVVERLDLVRVRDEAGRTLYDLPDAVRPPADVPAPVRFMYDFDNLFLSHADRSRVISEPGLAALPGFKAANVQPRMILVDGFTAGDWTVTRAGGTSTLNLHRWTPFPVTGEVEEEGRRLLEFLAPVDAHEIAVHDAPSRP